jgi:fatty acid desaturase
MVLENHMAGVREETLDNYSGTMPERLSGHVLRALSEVSVARTWLHIGLETLAIAAAIAFGEWLHRWYGYAAAVVWIGVRQHALLILMHEGTHYRVARSRRWNDFLSEVFFGSPLFVSMRDYRTSHFAHHRHVNTDKDPDWVVKQNEDWAFPKPGEKLAWLLLQDLLLLRVWEQLDRFVLSLNQPPRSWREFWTYHFWRGLYYAVALSVIVAFGWERQFLIYWVLPYFTWLKLILRWRSIAEHFGIENDSAYTLTRTTYPYLWERVLVTPKHANYHLDHHLYPSVPFYNLPRLHQELMKLPNFARTAHVTYGYWGVLRECLQHSTASGTAVQDKSPAGALETQALAVPRQ